MPPTDGIVDDPTITNKESLWRRVHPTQIKYDTSENPVLSTSAFKQRGQPLSVDIASLTTLEEALTKYSSHSMAEFAAKDARAVGCFIIRDPQPDNQAHALVYNGEHSTGQLTGSQIKLLTNNAKIIFFRPPL